MFLPHKMSFNFGPVVKVVCTPALVSARLSWWAISGMYGIHAKTCLSTTSSSSCSLRSSSLRNGKTRNKSLACVSGDSGFLDCLVPLSLWSFFLAFAGGSYASAICLSLDRSWPLWP